MDLAARMRETIIEGLAQGQGEVATPAYIYSVEQVGENYRDLKAALGTPLVVSIKANHCPELTARAAFHFEDGFEVASLGELRLRSGSRRKIYVNTPAYTKKMIEVAARYDAVFIIDHPAQLALVGAAKAQGSFDNSVLLRVNLAAERGVPIQAKDHFGMDPDTLLAAAAQARELDVKVAGLHIFSGSNGFVEKSAACVAVADSLFDAVGEALGYALEVLNLGGGIPADWRAQVIDFGAYRDLIAPLQRKAAVIHEAGRAIYASAGYFVTEVVSVKTIGAQQFVVCDGGMAQNFLLARTEQVIRRYAQPTLVGGQLADSAQDVIFVGSSCNSDDVIGAWRNCPYAIAPGDRLVFSDCGAYNALYTVSKFLALKDYAEYVI